MFENIERQYLQILFVFFIACSIIATSQSIVTTALVHIMEDFNVSSTMAQWTYSIFLLTLGVIVPLNAFISRRFNARSVYLAATSCFIIGSGVCYFSWDMVSLIIGRILQAIAFGIIMPYTQIILLKIVPEEQWQMLMGIYGISIAFTPVLGMMLGGYVIDVFGWKNIFSLFIILGVMTLVLGLIFVKLDFGCEDYPLDLLSAASSFIGCFGIMFGFINISEYGLMSINVLSPIIIGAISMTVFLKRQKNIDKPLINMHILKNRYFSTGILILIIVYFMYNGCTALIPIFIQGIAGHNAITTSLIVFPGGIALILFNFLGPYLTTKIGVKKVALAGTVILILGHASMAVFTRQTPIIFMAASQFIRYVGFGLLFIPISTWALTMIPQNSEDGSTLYNTSREIAGSVGSSVLVVITSILAGGEVGQNMQSVASFSQTSIILVILSITILLIIIFCVKDKKDIIN